jgi:hypothetical protein
LENTEIFKNSFSQRTHFFGEGNEEYFEVSGNILFFKIECSK